MASVQTIICEDQGQRNARSLMQVLGRDPVMIGQQAANGHLRKLAGAFKCAFERQLRPRQQTDWHGPCG